MNTYPVIRTRLFVILSILAMVFFLCGCHKDDDSINNDETICQCTDNNDSLPLYYANYLNDKEKEIRNLQEGITGVEDSFVFITDVHWMINNGYSPLIIEELLNRGLTNKVFFGGDIMYFESIDSLDPLEKANKQIDFHRAFVSSVTKFGRFFYIRGNHDINATLKYADDDPGEYWSLPMQAVKNLLFQPMWEGGYISNERDGGYDYVFDNTAKGIRYIILSCSTLKQSVKWLIEQFETTPSGYSIVVFNHYGATTPTTFVNGSSPVPFLDELMSAVNKREKGVVLTSSFDFSDADYEILAYFSGHTHMNSQSYSSGVVHINTGCDAICSEKPYLGEKNYDRTSGTTDEQLFDYILIDKQRNRIYCKRIGAGGDRFFNRTPTILSVSESVSLSSSLTGGIITWGAYDNDAPAVKTDPKLSRVIVMDGTVRGILPGEAVVYAMDEYGNREFFNVIVN